MAGQGMFDLAPTPQEEQQDIVFRHQLKLRGRSFTFRPAQQHATAAAQQQQQQHLGLVRTLAAAGHHGWLRASHES
ncbi:hypothetical protein OEZ86_000883 [Tetradesmus obliquus]|nr:hypothetical protein OEZ86_000883 [Tetradesmus obliquus]